MRFQFDRSLLIHCREIFLACHEFDNYSSLKTLFDIPDLLPFRHAIPFGENKSDLVDKFISFILSQTLVSGDPAIVAFLSFLLPRYADVDWMRGEIELLLEGFGSIVKDKKTESIIHRLKNEILNRLLILDFREQVKMVSQVIQENHIAAFYIHGPTECGQRMLVQRLSHIEPRWHMGKHILIDAGSKGVGKNSRSLWREITKHLEMSYDTEPMELARKIIKWWETQDVIIVLDTIDYISTEMLATWVLDFWNLIVETAKPNVHYSENHLILFMVDYRDRVAVSDMRFSISPDEVQKSFLPLYLPSTSLFPREELDIWISSSIEILHTLNVDDLLAKTENGKPELVYDVICSYCGLDWEGEIAP